MMITFQVQQQYVNAEGQLVSVHQVDQHLVYPGLAQSVEVSGTHTQVAQIPGQQVYLQQVRAIHISLSLSPSLLDSKVSSLCIVLSVDTCIYIRENKKISMMPLAKG